MDENIFSYINCKCAAVQNPETDIPLPAHTGYWNESQAWHRQHERKIVS